MESDRFQTSSGSPLLAVAEKVSFLIHDILVGRFIPQNISSIFLMFVDELELLQMVNRLTWIWAIVLHARLPSLVHEHEARLSKLPTCISTASSQAHQPGLRTGISMHRPSFIDAWVCLNTYPNRFRLHANIYVHAAHM